MTLVRMQTSPMLVAGGAGFLGSHLCERLLQQDTPVLCLDSLVTGKWANVAALAADRRFALREFDVSDPFEIAQMRGIFNLACPASPRHYQADPIRTTMTSVRGTYNLLELAKATGAPFLQASTSEVYGDPSVHPQTEAYWGNVNPTGPRACYDEGKRCAESLCFDYQRTHGVDVRVARIFNTYGPRMQIGDGRVVSNFIVQALKQEPITIYGDGSQTRSFCYVDDLIEGLVRFMKAPSGVKSPMNLGNPEEFTIAELAELTIELTGSRSQLIFLPLPSDDPTQRCPDIRLATKQLSWKPRVPLRAGLQRTIEYFDRLLAAEAPRPARRRRRISKGPLAASGEVASVMAASDSGSLVPAEMELLNGRH
jgi:UDP-glucuronate decarboxylase